MAGIVGVTLNQPNTLTDQDVAVEGFALLYESAAASRGDAAFQDVALPSVKRAVATEPRLDITAQVDGEGTRLKATFATEQVGANGTPELVVKEATLLLPDLDATAATRGLVQVLEASSNTNTRAVSDDALANRLFAELQMLLDELNSLFDDLDLILFAPLDPDPGALPDLGQYTFTDPYSERFWQLTWASWSGERAYDIEAMVSLGFRSSALTTLGVDFTRRVVDIVSSDPGET